MVATKMPAMIGAGFAITAASISDSSGFCRRFQRGNNAGGYEKASP